MVLVVLVVLVLLVLLVFVVLLVFDDNYVVDVPEIVRILKFWKNLTDWLSEKVTTREVIASKNEYNRILKTVPGQI